MGWVATEGMALLQTMNIREVISQAGLIWGSKELPLALVD